MHSLVMPLLSCAVILMVLSFVSKNICSASKINFSFNPNCLTDGSDCDKPWLMYGKKEGKNTTVHYLWSAMELPSFVMAVTSPQNEININWSELQSGTPGGIYFDEVPENTFGISFQTLILFNDVDDSGKIDNISEDDKKYAPLSEFDWNVKPSQNLTEGQTKFTFYSTTFRGKDMANNSEISFSVIANSENGRGDTLPHLITTPFSSQIEIVLDHVLLHFNDSDSHGNNRRLRSSDEDVIPISGFDYPRWALDAIVVSDDRPSGDEKGFVYKDEKSLDDEFTPGVFDLASITTEGARQGNSEKSGGYLQWRPVCYLTLDKDINLSTYPNINTSLPSVDSNHIENAKRSLFYVLFGKYIKNLISFQTSIAFGLSKDGFYTKHNYTEWTFSMGLGAVPDESFSTLIIIIISVAIGIPTTLFVFGGAYLVFRRLTRGRGEILICPDD